MVTIATGPSRHHVVSRVGKVLKYGHDGAIPLLENMAEIVVTRGRLKKFDCVRWNFVQVRNKRYSFWLPVYFLITIAKLCFVMLVGDDTKRR